MSILRRVAAVGIFAVACTLSLGCAHAHLQPATAEGRSEMARLAKAVADGTADANAPLALREAGPEGLAALLLELDAAPTDAARVARLRPAIDQVAKQKDAHVSRLYWYTDLDQAQAVAHETSRPILSLRLLGNLDDELSCANSRFFRTTLYSNVDVATYLRDHFVLHWSSERPAPVMTIDFRDGRKIQRTITGNSIHYVLDEEGRPLDAIPGLYGPAAFVTALAKVVDLDQRTHKMSASDRDAAVAMYHTAELTRLTAQWRSMLAGAGVTDPALFALPAPPPPGNVPAATIAAPLAYAKAAVEMPMVRAVHGASGRQAPLVADHRNVCGHRQAGRERAGARAREEPHGLVEPGRSASARRRGVRRPHRVVREAHGRRASPRGARSRVPRR